jgi:DNA-binding GntR family transcriptional regulator
MNRIWITILTQLEISSTVEAKNRRGWTVEASKVEELGQHTHLRIPLELASDAGGRLPVIPF